MPVIVLASPKGGCGKSTTAVILGTEIANLGAKVVMMDCDPNKSLTIWSEQEISPPSNMEVLSNVNQDNIISYIKDYDVDGTFVIIDLEGVASLILTKAASRADLIITPMQAKQLDAQIGLRAVSMVLDQEETLQRKIKHSLVLTMTKAIRSKQHKSILSGLQETGIHILEPELLERTAFDALFSYGGGLRNIPPHGNMEKAIENASKFTNAVFERMKG